MVTAKFRFKQVGVRLPVFAVKSPAGKYDFALIEKPRERNTAIGTEKYDRKIKVDRKAKRKT